MRRSRLRLGVPGELRDTQRRELLLPALWKAVSRGKKEKRKIKSKRKDNMTGTGVSSTVSRGAAQRLAARRRGPGRVKAAGRISCAWV